MQTAPVKSLSSKALNCSWVGYTALETIILLAQLKSGIDPIAMLRHHNYAARVFIVSDGGLLDFLCNHLALSQHCYSQQLPRPISDTHHPKSRAVRLFTKRFLT